MWNTKKNKSKRPLRKKNIEKKKKEKKSYEKAKQNYFFVDKKKHEITNRIKKSFVLGIAKRSLVTFNQKRVVLFLTGPWIQSWEDKL